MMKDNKQYIYKHVLKYFPISQTWTASQIVEHAALKETHKDHWNEHLKNISLAIQQIQKFSHQLPINTTTWRSKSHPELIDILFC